MIIILAVFGSFWGMKFVKGFHIMACIVSVRDMMIYNYIDITFLDNQSCVGVAHYTGFIKMNAKPSRIAFKTQCFDTPV